MAAAVLSTSQQGGPDAQLDNNVDDKTVAVGVSEADGEGSVQEEVAEHPDAHNVRRQVEYYFSDENLPTDLHLLQCCNGRENLPVSINRICGFKRMRSFKPRQMVVAALRRSTFLQVSEDGKTIKRKIPLIGKCLLDDQGEGSDDDIAYDPRTNLAIQHPVPLLPLHKKEHPPGMTKNMMKPTGFEETYVEGPLAPAEAEEEQAMYDPDKPFVERIEIAIQRFKQKRRMHEMYSKIFNKWMKFGGVESESRMFGGFSKQEMAQMDAEEIARATATHHVPWDRNEPNKWAVDFAGVGEAFLSSYYPAQYGHAPHNVKTACQVLRSFYNYLLYHGVCQEHNAQLLLARSVCDKAESELPQVYRTGNALPGPFNIAASTIFGGSYAGSYIGTSSWATEEEMKDTEEIGMQNEQAMVIYKTGVAAYGTDEQFDKLMGVNPSLAGLNPTISETVGLEIIRIEYPTDEIRQVYDAQRKEWKHKILLLPLGKLICKRWPMAEAKSYDLPLSHPRFKEKQDQGKDYEFWVEENVLNECFAGMKMNATVLTLDSGILILDDVKEVFCSFYKWIPNELWVDNKPPKFRLLNKEGLPTGEDETNREDGQRLEDELDKGDMSDDFSE